MSYPGPPPTIMFFNNGKWEELYGHDCWTMEEAYEYVAMLSPTHMYVVKEGVMPPPFPA